MHFKTYRKGGPNARASSKGDCERITAGSNRQFRKVRITQLSLFRGSLHEFAKPGCEPLSETFYWDTDTSTGAYLLSSP